MVWHLSLSAATATQFAYLGSVGIWGFGFKAWSLGFLSLGRVVQDSFSLSDLFSRLHAPPAFVQDLVTRV